MDRVELVAPAAICAFDGAIELGRLGRQDEELKAFVAQAVSKAAINSEPPSTWRAVTGNGIPARSLSKKEAAVLVARRSVCATVQRPTGQ